MIETYDVGRLAEDLRALLSDARRCYIRSATTLWNR
jgi:hypothetical protein